MNRFKKLLAGIVIASTLSATYSQAQFPTNGLVLNLWGGAGVEKSFGVPAANGDPVARWLDQSSAGNNVSTNPVGSQTPTYLTGVVNGQAVVNYDNINDRLQASTPLLTGSTDFSIFAVIRSSGSGERVIGANFGIGNLGGLEFNIGGANGRNLFLYNGSGMSGTKTLADGTWYLVQAEKSGSTYTLRVNNAVDATGTLGGSIAGSLNWTVGNAPDYNNVLPFGDMAQQLVYTRALTADEQSLVANRLADNYGLSIPEPSAVALVALAGLALWRRRRGRGES